MTGIIIICCCGIVVFRIALKQYTVVRCEIIERYPEGKINAAAYIVATVLGLFVFREYGWSIVGVLFSNVPSAAELGGEVTLKLSLATLPLLIVIIGVLAMVLVSIGMLGSSLSLSLAQEKLEDKIYRKEERIARIERKLQKEKEVKRLKRQTPR